MKNEGLNIVCILKILECSHSFSQTCINKYLIHKCQDMFEKPYSLIFHTCFNPTPGQGLLTILAATRKDRGGNLRSSHQSPINLTYWDLSEEQRSVVVIWENLNRTHCLWSCQDFILVRWCSSVEETSFLQQLKHYSEHSRHSLIHIILWHAKVLKISVTELKKKEKKN